MDLPHTRAYRVHDRNYYRLSLPRRPMYRLDRIFHLLAGIGLGMLLATLWAWLAGMIF